jgi:raffinose/stachyose/melibiose transport system substrate-binding protein
MICLILSLPLLTSCGNTPKTVVAQVEVNTGKVTLTCVLPFDNNKKNEAFKSFESNVKSLFPDYDIKFTFLKGDINAYNSKIKVMMYSDAPPDIFYSGDANFNEELYSEKRVEPLEKKLSNLNYWDMVIPSAKLAGATGHIYAVPMDEAYYSIMLINTELFSKNHVKIPENFEELKTASEQFKEKGITPIALGGKDGISAFKMLESFAGTIDNKITSKVTSGKLSFSGETFTQATASVKKLIELGAFQAKVETVSDEEAANLFYASNAAIYCTTSDKLNMASSKLNGKVMILYYPSIGKTPGSIQKNIVSGGVKKDCGLLVSSLTKYPSEATKLAVEMSKYYNKYLYEKQGADSLIYNLKSMEWKTKIVSNIGVSNLMTNVQKEDKVNTGLFEENISLNKEKSIEEASTAFMTGLLSVGDYLKEMDVAMKLK